MTDAIKKAIEGIAKDILTLSAQVIEGGKVGVNSKTGTNTLVNSKMYRELQSKEIDPQSIISPSGDSIVLDQLFENYVRFVEWDRPRKYGKKPPIDSLKGWAMERGIPTDNDTLWAISTAIWRDGHQGRPIMATLLREIDLYFEQEGNDKLMEAIINETTKYFN